MKRNASPIATTDAEQQNTKKIPTPRNTTVLIYLFNQIKV
jgi:hypothetical protein